LVFCHLGILFLSLFLPRNFFFIWEKVDGIDKVVFVGTRLSSHTFGYFRLDFWVIPWWWRSSLLVRLGVVSILLGGVESLTICGPIPLNLAFEWETIYKFKWIEFLLKISVY
jgi:hypothetical protein